MAAQNVPVFETHPILPPSESRCTAEEQHTLLKRRCSVNSLGSDGSESSVDSGHIDADSSDCASVCWSVEDDVTLSGDDVLTRINERADRLLGMLNKRTKKLSISSAVGTTTEPQLYPEISSDILETSDIHGTLDHELSCFFVADKLDEELTKVTDFDSLELFDQKIGILQTHLQIVTEKIAIKRSEISTNTHHIVDTSKHTPTKATPNVIPATWSQFPPIKAKRAPRNIATRRNDL